MTMITSCCLVFLRKKLISTDCFLMVHGLKKGNVANQREHLILLLANIDIRTKGFENYEQVNIHINRHI